MLRGLVRPAMRPCLGRSVSTGALDDLCKLPQPAQQLHVPFSLPADGALKAFDAWLARDWLSPWRRGLGSFALSEELLPFWAFDVRVTARYRGAVGHGAGGAVRWTAATEWAEEALRVGRGEKHAQVYASTELRPDLVAAAVAGQPLPDADGAKQGARLTASRPTAPAFTLSRGLAWTLAKRHIEDALTAHAASQLRRRAGAQSVRDVELRLSYTRVAATPLRLPAYLLRFTHGTTLSDGQAIVPERCALVSPLALHTPFLSLKHAAVAASRPWWAARTAPWPATRCCQRTRRARRGRSRLVRSFMPGMGHASIAGK